nr:T9SS type A sorting domain-containing protein [Bacteroidota bacterium]
MQINNACRVGNAPATPDYYKSTSFTYPLLSLEVSGNGHTDQAIVRFISGTTNAFDLNFDAEKLYSYGEMVPQIGSLAGGRILAINTLPLVKDELEVTLNFNCATAGYYSLGLQGITNIDPSIVLYLKDELNQNIINLSKDSTYGFMHEPANVRSRFKIFFNPSYDLINSITPESSFSAYAWQNTVTIIKKTQKKVQGDIFIYNLFGQKVYCRPISDESRSDFNVDLQAGYYIVSIRTDSHISNFKIRISK